MEKVGIGMMAELDKGETQDQAYAALSAQGGKFVGNRDKSSPGIV